MIVLRVGVLLAALVAASGAYGQRDAVTGVWTGTYICGQGVTGLTLTLAAEGAAVGGTFAFYPVPGGVQGVPRGAFEVEGGYEAGGRIVLHAGRWLRHPIGYVTVDLIGAVDEVGVKFAGDVIAPFANSGCTTFSLQRDDG